MNPFHTMQPRHLILPLLGLAGLGAWALCGSELHDAGRFDYKPNPLGIKMSPYGQVLAMGVQGTIESDWTALLGGGASDEPAPETEGEARAREERERQQRPGSRGLIAHLSHITGERTNPNPPNKAHRFYMRSQIEKTLRFAYELDPSHYGNYNSYHLFFLYDQLGTSGRSYMESRHPAIRLADFTTAYGLRELHDPRPALTAAAAAHNKLEIMLEDGREYPVGRLREQLQLINFCIRRHEELLAMAVENGTWDRLSPLRQAEVLDRRQFTKRMRDTAVKTIERLARGSEDQPLVHEAS